MERQIIKCFGSNKTKGRRQDSQNWIRSPMIPMHTFCSPQIYTLNNAYCLVLFNLGIPVVSYVLDKHVAITNRNCLPFPEQPCSPPVFLWDSRSSMFSLIGSVLSNIVCLFVWLLYYLSFFGSRFLIIPLLSSNLS